MEKTKLLFTDGIAPEGQLILDECTDVLDAEVCKGLSETDLEAKIKNCQAISVRSATTVSAAVLDKAPKLKVIGRAGIGVDNIDVKAATARGIIVMNTPDGNAITTAEHSISLLMAAARMIPQANKSLWDQKWDRKTFVGTELYSKTAGVIGFGNIGKLVAERLRGLKLNVIAYDPYADKEAAKALGVKIVELDELLKDSDIITLHVPLLDQTKHLINEAAFKKMKDGVILINCARGGVVCEKSLLAALEGNKLKAVALDVFEEEPVDPKNPLLTHPKVVCTPHLGAQTSEAQRNVSIAIAEQIRDYFKTGEVRNALNFPNLSGADAERMQPYANLGEKLGAFISQWTGEPLASVKIKYLGEIASMDCRSISLSVAKGLLEPIHSERVNYVNSLSVAKEAGLKMEESKSPDCQEFHSMIQLEVSTKSSKNFSLAGSLFGKKEARLVRLNEIELETAFSRHLLCMENEDQPGVIGAFGSLLGKKGINIENMHLALSPNNKRALSIVSVTTKVPPEVLKELESLDFVISAKAIEL